MNKSSNNTKQLTPYKKKIKQYNVSYCPNEFVAKNMFGQIRLGFKNQNNRVYAFRISPLPLSAYAKSIFNLQQTYSNIKGKTRKIIDIVQTQSHRYTVMEYFPKTFKTQIDEIRKKTKYMENLLSNFLQAYSALYFMKVFHGNISINNIGITFDGKVKIMDFRSLDLTFEEGSAKDYEDFRNMMCLIMERESIFPAKLQVLDNKDGNWIKLFSAWHIVTPIQFLYVPKKKPFQNMVVLLNKVENSLLDGNFENNVTLYNSIKVGLKLLMYSHLRKAQERDKDKKTLHELKRLKQILHPLNEHDLSYYNSIVWGMAKNSTFYGMTTTQRLTLIIALIEVLNHEYFFVQMIKEFDERYEDERTHSLLADNILFHYQQIIKSNLIDLS